jgi:flagellin|tara:strand:- start:81 stop:1610 length:1530 start_codon:yes stop_codon:yes gene_type:complete
MPIVVNSNTTATVASFNLSRANDALRTSLARLSSGKRIVNPADDAGGLSVANKLASKLDRTEAVRQNVQSGISYLQVQDGALSTVAKVVDRMAELRTMASDVTKNSQDIENYSKEFIELQKQLNQMYHEKFNGISLFSMSRSQAITNPPDLRPTLDKANSTLDASNRVYQTFSRNILTTADGVKQDGNISLNTVNLQYMLSIGGMDTTYITSTAAAIINAQKTNNEQANNNDLLGERSLINIGNVNNGNANDWNNNSVIDNILNVISDPLTREDFAAKGYVGDGNNVRAGGVDTVTTGNVMYQGLAYTAATTMKGNYDSTDNTIAAADIVFYQGAYYTATAGGAAAQASPPSATKGGTGQGDWTRVDDGSGNAITNPADFVAAGVGFTADTTTVFTSQDQVDTYMNEVYSSDHHLQSIMFVSMGTFNDLIERVADARAENGAEQNRLRMTSELLTQNQTNLEAAHGRIMDADIALESTRFARQNVLVQSSAAMVAQANQLTNIALTILG